MQLYKRSTVWWVRFADADGRDRRVSLRTRDAAAARIAAGLLARNVAMRRVGVPVADLHQARRPLLEHLGEWLARPGGGGTGTLYRRKARRAIEAAAAEHGWARLGDVTPAGARAYVAGLGGKPHTRNNLRGYVKAFFGWCVKQGRLAANPFDQTAAAKDPRPMQERALGDAECRALLAAPPPRGEQRGREWNRRRVLYAMLRMTALRPGEAADTERGDWRLDGLNPRVLVRAEVSKTGTARTIPLAQALVQLLIPYFEQLRPGERPFKIPDCRTFDRDLDRAGIPKRDEHGRSAGIYSLRRAAATSMVDAGVAAPQLQALMGHTTLKTTMRHYVDRLELPLRQAVNALGDWAGEGGVPGFVPSTWHGVAQHGTKFVHESTVGADSAPTVLPVSMRLRGVEPPRGINPTRT